MLKLIILTIRIEGYDKTVDILNVKVPCNDASDPWSGIMQYQV